MKGTNKNVCRHILDEHEWFLILDISIFFSASSHDSFVSEHIETLEEIDMEYKELAMESGIENWGRVPALNCTSSFITDLADAVVEALPSATPMSTSKSTSAEADNDPINYFVKLFFGSILAFILLLSPKMILAFKNSLV